ncbi:hypothetical protein [Enorma phocaeensis]|uniref:hypothetical protein n=1 Tax=Enorma phocaeensis TaxID=1871019 RepID=UPI0023555C7C|nr:hypothetical protein [Enorma phocaeensis]
MNDTREPKTITASAAAERWGCSKDDVYAWCKNGSVAGARKEGRTWAIPQNAERPLDKKLIREILWQLLELKNGTAHRFDLSEWGVKQTDLARYLNPLVDGCYIEQTPSAHIGEGTLSYRITNKGLRLLGRSGSKDTSVDVPQPLMIGATVTGRFTSQIISDLMGVAQ